MEAYLDAIEAPDEETRAAKLKEHARQVRTHILPPEAKNPSLTSQNADFVVLFLPGEVFYMAACGARSESDRGGG